MPAQADHPPKQPAGLEATSGQHPHRPVWRDGWAQTPQHASPRTAPRSRLVHGQNRPGHGERTPARDDTDREPHTPGPQGGCVEGQSQWGTGPEQDEPVQ
jgi:hypothetical protein